MFRLSFRFSAGHLLVFAAVCQLAACDDGGATTAGDSASGETASDSSSSDTPQDTAHDAGSGSDASPDTGGGDLGAGDLGKGDTPDAGNDTGPDTAIAASPIAVQGTWETNFGGIEVIGNGAWGTLAIVSYDNAKALAITQNPVDDAYNPAKFNRLVWKAVPGGGFWYCYADFGLGSAALALASTKTTDDSNPDKGGCGGFAWTKLTAKAPIAVGGTWKSDYGTEFVSSGKWAYMAMIRYDNAKRVAITRNPDNDPYNPGKFNRLVWTAPDAKGFWYCQAEFGMATADLAEQSTKTVDGKDPAKGGCGGFPWTQLSPTPAIETTGAWSTNFGGTELIDSSAWGPMAVVKYDNAKRVAVTRNAPNDKYNPGKFNKLAWTAPTAGALWYCYVDFGLATAELAAGSAKTADATAPDKGGCGGFPWTQLQALKP